MQNARQPLTLPPRQTSQVYLRYHRLPVSGKKADLVERITQHLAG